MIKKSVFSFVLLITFVLASRARHVGAADGPSTQSEGLSSMTLTGHESHVLSASFNRHGNEIVTASFDNTARIWNAFTGELIRILVGHRYPVNSAFLALIAILL